MDYSDCMSWANWYATVISQEIDEANKRQEGFDGSPAIFYDINNDSIPPHIIPLFLAMSRLATNACDLGINEKSDHAKILEAQLRCND